jgi:hypothetical protein
MMANPTPANCGCSTRLFDPESVKVFVQREKKRKED